MPFAVGIQVKAGLVNRRLLANRRQRVLQNAAAATVHVHIARSDERQVQSPANVGEARQAFGLAAVGKQLDGNPETVAKGLAHPVVLDVECKRLVRHPEDETVWQVVAIAKHLPRQRRILAFVRCTARRRH